MTRTPEKEWEETMTPEEVNFCRNEIWRRVCQEENPEYAQNFRAARFWISSQRRRYKRYREMGMYGSEDWIVKRWNPEKNRFDLYLVGYNYGD